VSETEPIVKSTTYVGIALNNGMFRVDTRRAGQNPASVSFPSDERGTEMLKRYVANMREPVRLAIAISAATIGIALALGEPPEREVFLVSPWVADQASALATYAARSV
jgi:hypothetical protein